MRKIKLGDVLKVKRGCSLSGDYYSTEGRLVRLTLGNFKYPEGGFKHNTSKENIYYVGEIKNEFILQKGDIITPLTEQVRGLLGSTATIPESNIFIQSGDIGLVECGPDIHKRFAYYLVSSPVVKKQLDAGSQQTKIRHTSPFAIENCVAFIPDLEEQKRIASILDAINSKILLNEKINDNLAQQIKLLYDRWFNQFDFPNEEGKPYKSSGGEMQVSSKYPCAFPTGWKIESIFKNSLSEIIQPGVIRFSIKNYLATSDVNGTDLSNGTPIEYETRESRANMQPTVNSVWFAKMKNSVKHIYLNQQMQRFIDSSILSTGFCGLQCTNNSFEYLASFIEHSYFETLKDVLAHGATQEAVNNDDLANICLLIPTDEVLLLYHNHTQPLFAQISKNMVENQELTKLRDWLLPLLMNGQATISD